MTPYTFVSAGKAVDKNRWPLVVGRLKGLGFKP